MQRVLSPDRNRRSRAKCRRGRTSAEIPDCPSCARLISRRNPAVGHMRSELWRSLPPGRLPSAGASLAPHDLLLAMSIRCEPLLLPSVRRSEEHTSELQSRLHLVCRLLLEKKNNTTPHSDEIPSTAPG